MTPPLKSVHFILGPEAGHDRIRGAYDASREIARCRDIECVVHTPRTPFALWLAPLRHVRTVWLRKFMPMVFQPIAVSKALSPGGGDLILAEGEKQMEIARMALKLVDGEAASRIVALPRLCFAYPPLLSAHTPPASPSVIYFGEITPDSGLESLIRTLNDKEYRDWKLRVAGTGSARTAMPLVRLAKSLALDSRIDWEGDIDDLSADIAASTVAFIPASQPWKLPTAAGCGVPAISSPSQLSALPQPGHYVPYSDIAGQLIDKFTDL